jgi:CubicO group peptidase (beta-lactamase class C family)
MDRRTFIGTAGSLAAGLILRDPTSVRAQPSPFGEEGLAAARAVLNQAIADGLMPGAVYLIARGDSVHAEALGARTMDDRAPMQRDTIFRIASMSKAVTATAVMMLAEEGKLALDAPVERWLPELANPRVLRRIDGPLDDTEPALRPIVVRDLLDFTLGFGLLFDNPPIQQAIDELQLVNGQPIPMTPHAPDEWLRRFATLPLMHQPGALWMYNTGSLLQGVLVARASGQTFDGYLHDRIIGPLGMRDTGFHVPPPKIERLAGCGPFTNPENGETVRMDRDGAESEYAAPPVFPSGAGGLLSTVDDYLIFARMLLKGGTHQGQRLLSEASVREMTRDQLTPEQRGASFFPGFFDTRSWGYGVAVVVEPDAVSPTPGRYGWIGGFGTEFVNDRDRDLTAILMTQSTDFLFSPRLEAFWKGVYAAAPALSSYRTTPGWW